MKSSNNLVSVIFYLSAKFVTQSLYTNSCEILSYRRRYFSPELWKAVYFIFKQPDFNYYWIFCGISEQRNKLVLRSLNILISPSCQSYFPEDSVLYNYNRNICAAWKVPVFGNILVRIQSKCGKIRTRITLNTDTFYAVLDNVVQATHLKRIILP